MTEAKKKISVKEFHAWLSGIEDMMEDNEGVWTPSATQWKRIRDKIKDIDDKVEIVRERDSESTPKREFRPAQVEPVYAESGLLAHPATELANKPFLPDSPIMAAKTPTIDTSNGQYRAPFE